MRSLWILLIIIIATSTTMGSDSLTIAFWNVENLFDLEDDPAKNDDEFARGGKKNMSTEILELKLARMSTVLIDLNADILGLCEVENRLVLELVNDHYKQRDYSIIHYDSPDERGIDVALLYDSKRITVKHSEPIAVLLPEGIATRDILYVRGNYGGVDLHLFVNHWPSKYGGAEATIPLRAAAAKTLRRAVENILAGDPQAEILIMGDLNDEPHEPSIRIHLGATLDEVRVGTDSFILHNLMAPFYKQKNKGTYKYKNTDMVIDHLIVSPGLYDQKGLSIIATGAQVLDRPKYRQQNGKYAGYPFRFWKGNEILGGYSDHLAISVKIIGK